jgi:hypothetical protein
MMSNNRPDRYTKSTERHRVGGASYRLDALERRIPVKLPLTLAETTKWFLMWCDKHGTAYATPKNEYTSDDWVWFDANEQNFKVSSAGYGK